MKYDTLVWDWNGTLCNDLAISIEVINSLLAEEHLPQLTGVAAYHAALGFPVIHYYEKLGFDFAKTPFSVLADRYIAAYTAAQSRAGLAADALPTLDALPARPFSTPSPMSRPT